MGVVLVTEASREVATAGTQVSLVAVPVSNAIKVWIHAPAANTGSLFVGDSNVSSTRGIEIPKGSTFVIDAPNELLDLAEIFVDAATSGDDFQVSYLKKIS